jgi:hypothetical protein
VPFSVSLTLYFVKIIEVQCKDLARERPWPVVCDITVHLAPHIVSLFLKGEGYELNM